MKTKHTPGPWHAFTGWVKGPGSESICFKKSSPGSIEQDDANLRLIASAPDLLRALKFQASWTMRDGTPCACPAGRNEDEPKGKMPHVHATSCDYLRTAIAKAEAP